MRSSSDPVRIRFGSGSGSGSGDTSISKDSSRTGPRQRAVTPQWTNCTQLVRQPRILQHSLERPPCVPSRPSTRKFCSTAWSDQTLCPAGQAPGNSAARPGASKNCAQTLWPAGQAPGNFTARRGASKNCGQQSRHPEILQHGLQRSGSDLARFWRQLGGILEPT